VLVVRLGKVGTLGVTHETSIAPAQGAVWNVNVMLYFKETLTSVRVCGYNTLNIFDEANLVFLMSRYLYSYLSTHNISGRPAGGTWELCKVHLTMTFE